ncbi:Uncharacterised protein [Mycobacteroides abscessus subsp. abscessus]|nr:Uncharacterised protein [Mycobacteroides abscessus subsp. abscessus]
MALATVGDSSVEVSIAKESFSGWIQPLAANSAVHGTSRATTS